MRALRALWLNLKDILDPRVQRGMDAIAYAVVSTVLFAGFAAHQTGITTRVGDMFWPSSNGVCYCDAPSGSVFHLTGVRWLVHSYYPWDSGILGSNAVDDMDYGLGYGVQEPARLPGGSWIHYTYVDSGWISGSGGYEAFQAPNGGRIAYFHLQWYQWHAVMRGGDQIGLSQWPTDPVYSGGGPGGPADAHLCVGVDELGKIWVMEAHPKPRPPMLSKKQVRVWNERRAEKREKLIPYLDRHKLLTRPAAFFRTQKLSVVGGIVSKETWHPAGHKGDAGYEQDVFQGETLIYWPRFKGVPHKWEKHRWIK